MVFNKTSGSNPFRLRRPRFSCVLCVKAVEVVFNQFRLRSIARRYRILYTTL